MKKERRKKFRRGTRRKMRKGQFGTKKGKEDMKKKENCQGRGKIKNVRVSGDIRMREKLRNYYVKEKWEEQSTSLKNKPGNVRIA